MKSPLILAIIVGLLLTFTITSTSIAGKQQSGNSHSSENPIVGLILGAVFVSTMIATTIVEDQVEKKRQEELKKTQESKQSCGEGCRCSDHPECDYGFYCETGRCVAF
jgi:hypothetical protein